MIEKHCNKLVEQNPKHQPAANRNSIQNHCFPRHHLRNVFFLHAENIINPKLFLTPFHDKTVCVKQKNTGTQSDNDNTQKQHDFQRSITAHCVNSLVSLNGTHDIKHHYGYHSHQYIWQIKLPVVFQICHGKSAI